MKLEPSRIRSTLAFAGLFQLTHEMLKQEILDRIKGFYGFLTLEDESFWMSESSEHQYRTEVLDLVPRKPFAASLTWLRQNDAISDPQIERLSEIFNHRHALTHELAKFLIDPTFEPDVTLFMDALAILGDISRFWTQTEIDIGSFEHLGEVDVDEVTPPSIMILSQCIEAYSASLPPVDQHEEDEGKSRGSSA